ncbi:MAG: hypothetical protein U0350_21470 [Caldilineaceae bacterium]
MKLSETDPDLSVCATPYTLSYSFEPIEGAAPTSCPLPPAPCSLSLAPCHPHLLVIAYGNTLRRDDGAGIGLAGILVKQWRICGVSIRYIVVPQLTPELALEIADPAVTGVVFVDAAHVVNAAHVDAAQAEPPLAIEMQAIQLDLATPSISHHLDAVGLLIYARLLEGCSAPAWMVSVPGIDFGYGEGFSLPVHTLLRHAPQLALEFLARVQECIREQVQYA